MQITLILAGILAVIASGASLYMLSPRDGRPQMAFLATELGAMAATLGILFLAIAGISLVFMGLR